MWTTVFSCLVVASLVGVVAFFWGKSIQRGQDREGWIERRRELDKLKIELRAKLREDLEALAAAREEFDKLPWNDKIKILEK